MTVVAGTNSATHIVVDWGRLHKGTKRTTGIDHPNKVPNPPQACVVGYKGIQPIDVGYNTILWRLEREN